MNDTAPQLAHVCTLKLRFAEPVIYNSTTGWRMSYRIAEGHAEGPRLIAEVADDGGELIVIRPDGTLDLDSRMMLRLVNDRFVYWRAKGSIVLPPDAVAGLLEGGKIVDAPIYVSPYFDIPDDDDLRWMTRAAFVGQGTFSTDSAEIAIFALGVKEP